MFNPRFVFCGVPVAAGLLAVVLSFGRASDAQPAKEIATAKETATRTVEDGGTGPYKAISVSDSSLATHTIFRPKDLSPFGEKAKLPVLTWGNGGCANSPQGHQNFLSEIASHGYLVIAIGPTGGGGGGGQKGGAPGGGGQKGGGGGGGTKSSQLLDAVDWAIAQNANKESIYFGKVDTSKIAVAGMSCGGLQALEVSTDKRISTTLVCNSGIIGGGGGGKGGGGGMPAVNKDLLAKLHGPILYLLGGSSDIAYNNGMDDFKRIEKLPVFVANQDVGHGGTYSRPHGGDFAKVAVAWLDWQLKGDKKASNMFTGDYTLAKDTKWKVEKKNIP